jgi:hypothetical protein
MLVNNPECEDRFEVFRPRIRTCGPMALPLHDDVGVDLSCVSTQFSTSQKLLGSSEIVTVTIRVRRWPTLDQSACCPPMEVRGAE